VWKISLFSPACVEISLFPLCTWRPRLPSPPAALQLAFGGFSALVVWLHSVDFLHQCVAAPDLNTLVELPEQDMHHRGFCASCVVLLSSAFT
jgi:hypothetical protein